MGLGGRSLSRVCPPRTVWWPTAAFGRPLSLFLGRPLSLFVGKPAEDPHARTVHEAYHFEHVPPPILRSPQI